MALTQSKVNKIVAQFEKWREGNRKALVRQYRPKLETIPPPAPVKLNASETAFMERAKEKGAHLYRAGWPDFLVEMADKTIAVEVKQGADTVRPNQRRMFTALERLDLPVLVWNPSIPNRLFPWREYHPDAVRKALDGKDCA